MVGAARPMGESKRDGLRVDFDRRLRLEILGSQITSDGGLLAYRELDDALGLTEVAGDVFQDSCTGKNGWHGMTGQYRQLVFGRLGGYEDETTPGVSDVILPCGGLLVARPSKERLYPPARWAVRDGASGDRCKH